MYIYNPATNKVNNLVQFFEKIHFPYSLCMDLILEHNFVFYDTFYYFRIA